MLFLCGVIEWELIFLMLVLLNVWNLGIYEFVVRLWVYVWMIGIKILESI